jgi:hypothetical protein
MHDSLYKLFEQLNKKITNTNSNISNTHEWYLIIVADITQIKRTTYIQSGFFIKKCTIQLLIKHIINDISVFIIQPNSKQPTLLHLHFSAFKSIYLQYKKNDIDINLSQLIPTLIYCTFELNIDSFNLNNIIKQQNIQCNVVNIYSTFPKYIVWINHILAFHTSFDNFELNKVLTVSFLTKGFFLDLFKNSKYYTHIEKDLIKNISGFFGSISDYKSITDCIENNQIDEFDLILLTQPTYLNFIYWYCDLFHSIENYKIAIIKAFKQSCKKNKRKNTTVSCFGEELESKYSFKLFLLFCYANFNKIKLEYSPKIKLEHIDPIDIKQYFNPENDTKILNSFYNHNTQFLFLQDPLNTDVHKMKTYDIHFFYSY